MKKLVLLISAFLLLTSFTLFQKDIYIVKKGYTVAVSEEGYNKMMDAASSKDQAYFEELLKQRYIVTLPNDIEVYIVERKVLAGYSIVRAKGKDIKMWTVNESLKKK